jgi:hypothetical protein
MTTLVTMTMVVTMRSQRMHKRYHHHHHQQQQQQRH